MTWEVARTNIGFWVAAITLISVLIMGFLGLVPKEVVLVVSAICAVGLR